MTDEKRAARRHAAAQLGRSGDRRAVPHLITSLADESLLVRVVAIISLGQLGDRRATEAILVQLTDEEAMVREQAATALGRIRDERAVPALIARLADNEEGVRASAARALGRIGDRSGIPGLQRCLDDASADVRAAAASALGDIGGPAVVPSLEHRLDDAAQEVRSGAFQALARVVGEQTLLRGGVAGMVSRLAHRYPEARAYAAMRLGHSGDQTAVKGLLAALKPDESQVCVQTSLALARLGGQAARDGLLKVLKETQDPVLWSAVATAVGRLKEPRAVQPLIEGLKAGRSGWSVAFPAAMALGEIGDKGAIPALRERLEDWTMPNRPAVVGVLARLGDDEAWSILVKASRSDDEAERLAAATWLGYTQARRALAPLVALLSDRSARIRATAARALGNVSSPSGAAIRALEKAFEDSDASVREAAGDALQMIRDRRAKDGAGSSSRPTRED